MSNSLDVSRVSWPAVKCGGDTPEARRAISCLGNYVTRGFYSEEDIKAVAMDGLEQNGDLAPRNLKHQAKEASSSHPGEVNTSAWWGAARWYPTQKALLGL